ncbi:oligopeptide transport system permease protein OppB [Scardovia inopinata]|uniref:ABC transmembrane type-1 domain-containing protein n=1 Tax=Scardovia inopinata F0304 TaxID=641146 RepID=W5IK48_SCAIO|nr:ABC transporter permease [Scardovia inopinata]EFG27272.1 hypothetical protein HMPREF9020_00913 [Scardovia inopinata F0304]SUV50949.1 oligopeptide transport system permease protein OppB [Scardovia inopinata]
MFKFIIKRLGRYIVLLFVAISMTFFLSSWFMHPRSNYEQRTPRPPQASIERALDNANLNDHTNVFVRYWRWLTGVVTRWDWGQTPSGQKINNIMAPRIIASTELVTLATVLGILLGVSLGVYTAMRQYKWQDTFWTGLASILMCVPTPVIALLLIFFFININTWSGTTIFYVTGLSSYTGSNPFAWFGDFVRHIFIPTLVLTIIGAVGYHISQRTYLLDEIRADYVRTARMKGLTRRQAIRKHALRASFIPTAVSIAFSIAGVFSGATLTESMFGIEGMGKYFINALNNNDIYGTVAYMAFGGVCTLVGALLADIAAAILDPRIRMS